MSTKNKITEDILATLESKKGSLALIMKASWEATKRDGVSVAGHFTKFHLTLMMLIQTDTSFAHDITLGILADHLLPLLTEEEKEALRDESTNVRK